MAAVEEVEVDQEEVEGVDPVLEEEEVVVAVVRISNYTSN